MALDFPLGPVVGQQFPFTPVPGQPVFIWDGEKWVPATSTGTTDWSSITNKPATFPPDPEAVDDRVGSLLTAGTNITLAYNDAANTLTINSTGGVAAAPFDAMAYSGMQINGGMEVSQELGAATVNSANSQPFVADGWRLFSSGVQVLTSGTNTTAPAGFTKGLTAYVSTANAAPAATNGSWFTQAIEGYRIARLAWGTASAQPITLSFWVRSWVTGMFSGSIRNGAANRSYPFSFTVSAADTYEYKTITIPGDTSGTWAVDNTTGMLVAFALMAGTSAAASAGSWIAGNFAAATGTTNAVSTSAKSSYITGVTVLPGTQTPTAAQSPNIMRPYDQELVTCRRYYQKLGGKVSADLQLMGYNLAGQSVALTFALSPSMRAAPTATSFGTFSSANAGAMLLYAGNDTFAWQHLAVATGPVSVYSTGGGFILDARL